MSATADWAGELGRRWAAMAERQDAMLSRFQAAGLDALGDVAGKRVLDLGCGPGESSFALADRGAEVVGLDVSAELLEVARDRAEARRGEAATPDFVLADAAEARFDAPFDALFSRFGAMFFPDPGPAWRNLRDAMTPGAPLVVVAWRTPRENEWVSTPLGAARPWLPPQPAPVTGDPGPFGWADPAFFEGVLREAGWRDVAWTAEDRDIAFAEGAEDPAAAAAEAMRFGTPASARIEGIEDEDDRAQAWAAVEAALRGKVEDGAVRLTGAVWVVTARA